MYIVHNKNVLPSVLHYNNTQVDDFSGSSPGSENKEW